jgi:LmbE family N-acetylglucosaminyl deacetylase
VTKINLSAVSPAGRIVIVAPHPDNEVLAVGGLMAMASMEGFQLEVVAVTDGEASHRGSRRITPAQLRDLREHETADAYRELGIHPPRFRLGIPDGKVSENRDALRQFLAIRVAGATTAIGPLESDGSEDHRAVGETLAEVASAFGVRLWRYAVWACDGFDKVGEPSPCDLVLPYEVRARKERAIRCLSSQIYPLGPGEGDGPVYPPGFLERFERPCESLWPDRSEC